MAPEEGRSGSHSRRGQANVPAPRFHATRLKLDAFPGCRVCTVLRLIASGVGREGGGPGRREKGRVTSGEAGSSPRPHVNAAPARTQLRQVGGNVSGWKGEAWRGRQGSTREGGAEEKSEERKLTEESDCKDEVRWR
ncbi:hypothetical protein E2C01_096904 [Portunus trituberculatus]|uniref:Uncharacterized protein n=1 Tax=Portunus trituberculatus TaxID=210409 RepID=A0A5B7JWV6_PORTR|nr:hypothetical protein [Portunus trituberculatus]